jgi:hypothetical protein
MKPAIDSAIRGDLPKHHLGNWEDIVSLKEMYPEGNGDQYVIYIVVGGIEFSIFMYWHYRRWCIGASEHGDNSIWGIGKLVLYPSAERLRDILRAH